jgi:hypothetical protein
MNRGSRGEAVFEQDIIRIKQDLFGDRVNLFEGKRHKGVNGTVALDRIEKIELRDLLGKGWLTHDGIWLIHLMYSVVSCHFILLSLSRYCVYHLPSPKFPLSDF